MKREDIEKAARMFACETKRDAEGMINAQNGFKKGAQWRIGSVWHKPQEKPEERKFVLAEDETKGHFSIYKLTGQDWTKLVEDYNLFRWAYIEDLLPNMED